MVKTVELGLNFLEPLPISFIVNLLAPIHEPLSQHLQFLFIFLFQGYAQ